LTSPIGTSGGADPFTRVAMPTPPHPVVENVITGERNATGATGTCSPGPRHRDCRSSDVLRDGDAPW
jgi:hypothetical protein